MPSPSVQANLGGKLKPAMDSEILRAVSAYCETLSTRKSARAKTWGAAATLHAAQCNLHPSLAAVEFKTLMSILSDFGAVEFDAMKSKVLYVPNKLRSLAALPVRILVNRPEQCRRCVENLRESKTLAIDARWYKTELCLLQVISVTARNHVYLFDICKLKSAALEPLRLLLEDPKILKIGHDLRLCSKLLSMSPVKARLHHVMDTQVLRQSIVNDTNSYVDLGKLLTEYGIKMHVDKDPLYVAFKRNCDVWKERPLNDDAMHYACLGVQYLGLLNDRLQDDLILKLQDRSTANIDKVMLFDEIDPHDPHVQPLNVNLWLEFDAEGKPTYTPALDADDSLEEAVSKLEIKSEDEEPLESPAPNGVDPKCSEVDIVLDPDLESLLDKFPEFARNAIVTALRTDSRLKNKQIVDVKVDAVRPIVLGLGTHDVILSELTQREQLDEYIDKLENIHFSDDNRGGISGTLHRISVMRSRARALPNAPLSNVIGLTYRIGRPRFGNPGTILDLLHRIRSSQTSLIVLGAPGCGKSTLLRSYIRYVAHDLGQSTVVVDTSNELGGDGIAPNPVIQPARRLMVPERRHQYLQLLEAVQNHSPKVVVVDEIATKQEVDTLRSISQRGVRCLATCHGTSLSSLLSNPDLKGLAGGTQMVILSSFEASVAKKNRGEAAQKSGNVKKSQIERAGLPPFGVAVEIVDYHTLVVHHDVARAVDNLLANGRNRIETRRLVGEDNRIIARFSMT